MSTTSKSTFRMLIDRWPSAAEFARQMGVEYQQVWGWYRRDSIPAAYWRDFIRVARKLGIEVDADDLIAITQQRPKRAAVGTSKRYAVM